MTIIFWNCRSLNNKHEELDALIQIHNPDVIIIMETWLSPNNIFQINNYNTYRSDRNSIGGGVLISVKTNIKSNLISTNINFPNTELIGININYYSTNINIFAWYSPSFNVDDHMFENFLDSYPNHSLLIGDFNSHHPMWGSRASSASGSKLANLINNSNYININNGQITYQKILSNYTAVLDLVFCTNDIINKSKMYMTDINFGSDHFPGIVIIESKNKNNHIKSFNINKFQSIISNIIPDLNADDDDNLRIIQKTMKKSFIKRNISSNNKQPWWTKDCTDACKLVYKQKKILDKNCNITNINNYKNYTNQMKLIIKKCKTNYWNNLLTNLSFQQNTKQLWKICNNSQNPSPNQKNCILNANAFISFFSTPHNKTNNNQCQIYGPDTEKSNDYNFPLTNNEFNDIINNTKDTTPGHDSITFNIIKNLPNTWIHYIIDLFNNNIKKITCPNSFKHDLISPILKPGLDPNLPISHRPITLISCFAKIQEKYIVNRINWYLEKNNLYANHQFAYRTNLGTADALRYFYHSISYQAKIKKMFVHCITYDISKAFESVSLNKLCICMQDLNIPNNYINWFMFYLTNRTFQIKTYNSISNTSNRPSEILQGSPSGAMLYNIYNINLCKTLERNDCNYSSFADDLIIWIADTNSDIAKAKIQNISDIIFNWFNENDLIINKTKTKHIIFSYHKSRHALLNQNNIIIDNNYIDTVDCIKYLGILFHETFSNILEINRIKTKIEKRIILIKRLATKTNGITLKLSLMLYRNLCRSIFVYGTNIYICWGKTSINSLYVINNHCLRSISGLILSTPTYCLYPICDELPIDFLLLKNFINHSNNILEI